MFDLIHTLPLLTSQPDIVIWHQPAAKVCDLPKNLLPRLTQASLAPWLIPKFKTYPLADISTTVNTGDAPTEQAFLDTLAGYHETLTRLTLDRQTFSNSMTLSDFLLHLSTCLPSLQHLSLWNRGELVSEFFYVPFEH